jgi:hypothetical protein
VKYVFLILLFLSTSCSDGIQNKKTATSNIDTEKLFNPNPQPDESEKPEQVFANCIMLDPDSLAARIAFEKTSFSNTSELQIFLQKNLAYFSNQKLYIIYAKSTPFNKILDIIEILKALKITNYKALPLIRVSDNLNTPNQQ